VPQHLDCEGEISLGNVELLHITREFSHETVSLSGPYGNGRQLRPDCSAAVR
jgi:hypothetical protein